MELALTSSRLSAEHAEFDADAGTDADALHFDFEDESCSDSSVADGRDSIISIRARSSQASGGGGGGKGAAVAAGAGGGAPAGRGAASAAARGRGGGSGGAVAGAGAAAGRPHWHWFSVNSALVLVNFAALLAIVALNLVLQCTSFMDGVTGVPGARQHWGSTSTLQTMTLIVGFIALAVVVHFIKRVTCDWRKTIAWEFHEFEDEDWERRLEEGERPHGATYSEEHPVGAMVHAARNHGKGLWVYFVGSAAAGFHDPHFLRIVAMGELVDIIFHLFALRNFSEHGVGWAGLTVYALVLICKSHSLPLLKMVRAPTLPPSVGGEGAGAGAGARLTTATQANGRSLRRILLLNVSCDVFLALFPLLSWAMSSRWAYAASKQGDAMPGAGGGGRYVCISIVGRRATGLKIGQLEGASCLDISY